MKRKGKTEERRQQERAGEYVPVEADFVLKHGAEEGVPEPCWMEQSFWREALAKYLQRGSAVLGLVLVLGVCLMAGIGPGMNHYSFDRQDLSRKNLAPRIPVLEILGIFDGDERIETAGGVRAVNGYRENKLDGVYYWFGSDGFGRDIWTRTWAGARVSLMIAAAAAAVNMVIGVSYGMISGYFGGRVDMVMQRLLEILRGCPRLVIITLLFLVLGPGIVTVILALVLTEWMGMSRIVRAEVLRLKEQEFILASRALGAGSFSIMFGGILPNSMGPVLTQAMLSIPTAIFTEAFLSFVGLGIPAPQCSLGTMIFDGFHCFTIHPYQMVIPLTVMVVLMLGFYLMADGLRKALVDRETGERGK